MGVIYMRVLILGGTGMLGHKVWQYFAPRYDTYITIRKTMEDIKTYSIFEPSRTLCDVNAMNFENIKKAVMEVRPDVVINCIGIVKQHYLSSDYELNLMLNSLLPQKLSKLCNEIKSKLLHVSTDCVFSGKQGLYTEKDQPDPVDLYGRTKLSGEVTGKGVLTFRTSIIGRELYSTNGLVEWFLSAGKEIKGYTNAVFSGFTSLELAHIFAEVLEQNKLLEGIYHLSSTPISKYDLLMLLRDELKLKTKIIPTDEPVIDRSLNNSKFCLQTAFTPPTWQKMIHDMANDQTPYNLWRPQCEHF